MVTPTRIGLLALAAALLYWLGFRKFPCPYCGGQGWRWEAKRGVWYVISCEKCQTEEKEWSTGIPLGKEEGRVVGDREVQE